MLNNRILALIQAPDTIKTEDLDLLKNARQKYPYMQGLRAIYLLGLHRFQQDLYQRECSITAVYTTQRRVLYDLVNGHLNTENQQVEENKIPSDLNERLVETDEIASSDENSLNETPEDTTPQACDASFNVGVEDEEVSEKQEEVAIIMPHKKLINGTTSLKNWLYPAAFSVEMEDSPLDKGCIIDTFINANPRIGSLPYHAPALVEFQYRKDCNISHLVTDTLAEVYWEQELYDKAYQAYQILKQKFPEKKKEYNAILRKIKELKA